jgi:hypothetical protein
MYTVVCGCKIEYCGSSIRRAEAVYAKHRGGCWHTYMLSPESKRIREWIPGILFAAYFGGDC